MTYFPCFAGVKMTSSNFPSDVHSRHLACFEREIVGRTNLCQLSLSTRSPIINASKNYVFKT